MKLSGLSYDDVLIIPKYSEVNHRSDCNIETRLTKKYKLQIPLLSAPMDTITESEMCIALHNLGGCGCIHRFQSIERHASEISKFVNTLDSDYWDTVPVVGVVGVTGDYFERATELKQSGCNILLLDVAHGHHKLVKDAMSKLKSLNIDIIAGNIVTEDAAIDLIEWGADALRVGIGGGSMCSTRIKTGIGVPQLTAVQWVSRIADTYNDIPVIADGGIRNPGDVSKALSAGASTVMIGSLLSGTKESPGEIQKQGAWPNEILYKKYRGSASLDSKLARNESGKNVEGESTLVPYKGKIERIITDIISGIKSTMSYVGVNKLEDLSIHSDFIEITNAGYIESTPHLMKG